MCSFTMHLMTVMGLKFSFWLGCRKSSWNSNSSVAAVAAVIIAADIYELATPATAVAGLAAIITEFAAATNLSQPSVRTYFLSNSCQ